MSVSAKRYRSYRVARLTEAEFMSWVTYCAVAVDCDPITGCTAHQHSSQDRPVGRSVTFVMTTPEADHAGASPTRLVCETVQVSEVDAVVDFMIQNHLVLGALNDAGELVYLPTPRGVAYGCTGDDHLLATAGVSPHDNGDTTHFEQ